MGAPAEAARQLRHDLKTPLTALIGFLELIEDRPAVRMLALIDEQLADGGVLAGGGAGGCRTGDSSDGRDR